MHVAVVARVLHASQEGLVTPQKSPQPGCYHPPKRAHSLSNTSLHLSPQPGCMSTKKRLVTTLRQHDAKAGKSYDGKTVTKTQTESEVLLTPDYQTRKLYSKTKGKGLAYKPLPPKGAMTNSGISSSVYHTEMDCRAPAATMEDLSDCAGDSDDSHDPTGGTYTKPPRPSIKKKTAKLIKQGHSCLQSPACLLAIYVCCGLLLAACIATLLVINLVVVRPYLKADHFIPSQCHAVESVYASEDYQCSCGKDCSSSFPCLEVVVEYLASDGQHHRGFLREHEVALKTKVSCCCCSTMSFI